MSSTARVQDVADAPQDVHPGAVRVDALLAEWWRQGLSDGTIWNRMAHLRRLARRIGTLGVVQGQRELRDRVAVRNLN